jgi:hypothetical protein
MFAILPLCRCLILVLFCTLFVGSPIGSSAQEEGAAKPLVWAGTWMNRKYNTSGPLKCTATRKDDATSDAVFEGTFMRDPFKYSAVVNTKAEKSQTLLSGTTDLDGDRYEWTGYVRGRILFGQFRSLKGHNGEFRLEQQ